MRPFFTFFISLSILASGCGKFETSPYAVNIPEEMRGLNARNVNRVLAAAETADDTVSILFTGDSQRFYDELDLLVAKTNTLSNVDFLILAGDISDFGLAREFSWIYQRLEGLNIPYLCAIGNHDLTARGGEVYRQMFGPKNFSFTYKDYKFLFHDTNGREYNFNGSVPDLGWLGAEMNNTLPSWIIGVSHVPPFNPDFDPALVNPYKDLFAAKNNFILSLHGHNHVTYDDFRYNDHVRYIISNSVYEREATLLKLYHGGITKTMIPY